MIGGKKIKFNFDAAKFDDELSLDELKERNRKQVMAQLEAQRNPIRPQRSLEQVIGETVIEAVQEPFKTIGKGLNQLGITGILNPNKNLLEKVEPAINPIAGAINLATGIAEVPMLIGTVPLNTINAGLNEVGLGKVAEPVNKAFETVANAPKNIAQEISEAAEKHGIATQIRNFVDQKAVEYGLSTTPVRIDPETGAEITEATNNLTGLAAIVGVTAGIGEVAGGLKTNIKTQSKLAEMGYAKEEISKMKPKEAEKIVNDKLQEEVRQELDTYAKEKTDINKIADEVTKKELVPNAEKQTSDLPQYFTKEEAPANIKENFKPSSRDFKEVPGAKENIPKQEYKTLEDGTKVFLVDGNYIRNNVDIDFTMGGHDYVYPKYIPKNEIWLDKDMARNDFENTLRHENTERQKMISGKKYPEAHELANKEEIKIRQGKETKTAIPDQSVQSLPKTENIEQKPIEKVVTALEKPEEIKTPLKKEEIAQAEKELINSNADPEVIGITKQKLGELREKTGLPELEKTVRQHIPEESQKVITEIEQGVRTPEILLNEIRNKKSTSTQPFEATYFLTRENNRWEATIEKLKEAKKNGDEALVKILDLQANESLSKMKEMTDTFSQAGTDWGRFGRFMQEGMKKDYSIARLMQRAELNSPDGKVLPETKTKLENYAFEIGKVKEAIDKYQSKNPNKTIDDFIKDIQRREAFEQRRTKRVATKEELRTQREQLWVDLYKATSVSAANIPLTPEAIKVMGKITENYVREGITTASQIVDEFYNGFKGQVSKEDIMKAISGYGREQQKTKSELQGQLSTAKKEMRLLLQIEDAKKGILPTPKERAVPNKRIQELQDQLKAIKKENVDISDATKLKAQKTRALNNIKEYERRLREKDYVKKERVSVIADEQLNNLRVKERQLKKQVELELYKEKRRNMTTGEKIKDEFVRISNIPRTLLATADLSMPLRQGLPASSANPKMAYEAFKEMHKASVSQKHFDALMTEIENSPYARTFEKMGIQFTGIGDDLVALAKKEEAFIASGVLSKIPFVKSTLGRVTEFSERGAIAYLNYMRWKMGEKHVKLMLEKGLTPENSLKAYKDLGSVINWGTGRADLGMFERIPGLANTVMFSPRTFVAKWELMNPANYVKLAPEARKLFMKQQMATVAQGVMFLNLMKLAGAEVETDPRSADFAKARIGDTRIDVFGGQQQNFVFATRMAFGLFEPITGEPNMKTADGGMYSKDMLSLIGKYARNKLSPQAALGVDYLSGKTTMGDDFAESFKDDPLARFIPLVWQDMLEAQANLGFGAIGTTILGFYGAGTQTYKPKDNGKINFNFDIDFKFN